MGRERYDLSDETRNKGLRELTDQGLLGLARRPVPAAPFDERFRARNVYMLRPQAWAAKGPRRPPAPDSLTDGLPADVAGHGALRAVIYEPGQDGHELTACPSRRRGWPQRACLAF